MEPLFRRHWITCVAAGLLVACGGGDDEDAFPLVPPSAAGDACSVANQKQFVLDRTNDWYLFPELLPQNVNPAQYNTPAELLDALTATARAQHKDRSFSYLTSISAEQQFFAEGQSVGFGVGIAVDDTERRLFVTQVYAGSAAAAAGFQRGDEILEIGTSTASLQKVSDLIAQNALNDALGPSEAGVTRVLRVRNLSGVTADRTVTKQTFSIDPVPATAVIQRPGQTPVGYINLRTFISPADAPLRNVFAQFKQQSVQDVIIDLRYNGGGLVATAELLGNLLASGRAGEIFYQLKLNPRHAAEEETVRFGAVAEAIPAMQVAFLTTDASASASELLINSMAPYARTAIVGQPTYGKPVGQYAFDLSACDVRLRLVTFKTVNRDGHGDYFQGLPDTQFTDDYCAAGDDLTRAQNDPNEGMLSEALHWIDHGVCRSSARLPSGAEAPSVSTAKVPLPRQPAPAQVYQPGFY